MCNAVQMVVSHLELIIVEWNDCLSKQAVMEVAGDAITAAVAAR